MKKIISLTLLVLFISKVSLGQNASPDMCHLLNLAINNDSCIKVLRIDTSKFDNLYIEYYETLLLPCKSVTINHKTIPIVTFSLMPKQVLDVYIASINKLDETEETYEVSIANVDYYLVMNIYFIKRNGEWVIQKKIVGRL